MKGLNTDDLMFIDSCIKGLEDSLPAIFSRKLIPQYLGGILSSGTLANLASMGCGPRFVRNGRNAVYEKFSFLDWLRIYLEGGREKLRTVYVRTDSSITM